MTWMMDPGDKVTVLIFGCCRRARVVLDGIVEGHAGNTRACFSWTIGGTMDDKLTGRCFHQDEGSTWMRGWRGKMRKKALRVAGALG